LDALDFIIFQRSWTFIPVNPDLKKISIMDSRHCWSQDNGHFVAFSVHDRAK